MKETIRSLQEEMERALGQLAGPNHDNPAPESGYRLVAEYWQRLKLHIRQSGFPDDAAEIDFFRNIKPRFTFLLEYFLLLVRHQAYADAGAEALEAFRREERGRIERFNQQHAAFIKYYDAGRTEWDDQYFLRRKYRKAQRPPSQVYDRTADFWTNGDWIVTLLMAHRRFEEILHEALPPAGRLPAAGAPPGKF